MKSTIPSSVLQAYDIGTVKKIEPISIGLIHLTFKIIADRGTYIVQRLHPILNSEETAQDFLAVTNYLHGQKFPAPECVLSKEEKVLVSDGEHQWRMQTFLEGDTIEKIETSAQAREAGAMYARFHRVMDKIPYQFQSKKVLHETEKVYETFRSTVLPLTKSPPLAGSRPTAGGEVEGVADEITFITRELPKLFLPADLPMRVIHGDPKISNILFDKKGKAKALVDLDTCNRRPILVELGDAFRSWCGLEEDDPKNPFRIEIFEAGWKGYMSEAEGFLTAREIELVPQAIGTITLELASRFLADYFNDSYFGWDQKRYPSRRAHNLARAHGQIALYHDLQENIEKVKEIVMT